VNSSKKQNHPWRNGRSNRFITHLETLPLPERLKIEAAEREFVSRKDLVGSPQRAVIRDFTRSLVGSREEALT
jgi:hypothetical protein